MIEVAKHIFGHTHKTHTHTKPLIGAAPLHKKEEETSWGWVGPSSAQTGTGTEFFLI